MNRFAFACCVALSLTGAQQADACRLALVLALDISSSVDAREDRLQRDGLGAALLAPEVQRAFFMGPGDVAVSVFEWSGRYNQELLVDWTLIDDREDLRRIADRVSASKRSHREFPTAMGTALSYANALFERGPDCQNRTIDLAGDGSNNEGPLPREIYQQSGFRSVTVNGLMVNAAQFESETQLISFFQTEVLHGPGAFLEVAQGFSDYERAMRQKLERELRPPAIGSLTDYTGNSPG